MAVAGRVRAAAVAVVLVACPMLATACGSGGGTTTGTVPLTTVPPPYTYDFTVPLGTADRLASGEQVNVMPEELDAKLGQTIRIVNLDNVSHEIGAWYVLKGSTLTYRFNATGTFTGTCTTHSSGKFTLIVTA